MNKKRLKIDKDLQRLIKVSFPTRLRKKQK